jgi:hypothetical protein
MGCGGGSELPSHISSAFFGGQGFAPLIAGGIYRVGVLCYLDLCNCPYTLLLDFWSFLLASIGQDGNLEYTSYQE